MEDARKAAAWYGYGAHVLLDPIEVPGTAYVVDLAKRTRMLLESTEAEEAGAAGATGATGAADTAGGGGRGRRHGCSRSDRNGMRGRGGGHDRGGGCSRGGGCCRA